MAAIAAGNRVLVVSPDDQLPRRIINLITASESATSPGAIIPWKISNKYYDANVHFSISTVKLDDIDDVTTFGDDGEGVPAVIYAFERAAATSYRPQFLRFVALHSAAIDAAEICVAACLSNLNTETTAEDDAEDEETIDDFFSQHRFEYVSTNVATRLESSHDAAGIDRIREALHTVMWPSLVRKKPAARSRTMPVVFNDDSIDGVEGLSLNVNDITEDIARSLFTMPDGALGEHELAALEAWLDQDSDAAWKGSQNEASTREFVLSAAQLQSTALNRFDNDFSEFISAPAIQVQPSHTLTPLSGIHGSITFDAHNDDPFIPSKTDISVASSRIFKQGVDDLDAEGLGAFDLNQVLSTLQAMKEEVSLIDDIDERRRAAATAALGLVSGLGLGAGLDDDGSELGESLTA